jgi:hypothetical protein
VDDVALKVVPALLLFVWSLPLKGLENLVMVLVRGQTEAEIEACTRHDSHQSWNGRLPAPRFIGSHDGLGDAEPVGQLPLRESRLESSREYEAAGNGRALQEM